MRAYLLVAFGLLLPGLTGCAKIEARELIREGNHLYNESLYSEAIDKYSKAAELEPDGVKLFWNRACAAEGLVLRLKDNPEKGEERKKYADMALQDFQRWFDRLEEKTEEDKKNYSEHRLAILSADQRCDDLIAHWQEKLQANPKEEGLYSVIARTYDEICDDKVKATQWYVKRTQDFPVSPTAWYALGVRMFEPLFPTPDSGLPFNDSLQPAERVARADKVIEILQEATKLKPTYRDPYVWRAMAYTQKSMARVYGDPPADTKEKLEAILAREDTMFAWKEQRQVCNIDKLPDCPLSSDASAIFRSPRDFSGEGKTVSLAGKVVENSVKPLEAKERSYEMLLEVKIEGSAPPEEDNQRSRRRKKAPAKPKAEKRQIRVEFSLAPPQKDEEGNPIDDSEDIKARIDEWNAGGRATFDGAISPDAKTLTVEERPLMGCCPMAPISAADVAADQDLRAQLEAELAGGKGSKKKRRRRRKR